MREGFTVGIRRYDGTFPSLGISGQLPTRVTTRVVRARLGSFLHRFRALERARDVGAGDLALYFRASSGEPWMPVFEIWDGRATRERLRLYCPFRTDWGGVRAALADTRARWWARYREVPAAPPPSADVLPLFSSRDSEHDGRRS